MTNIVKQICPLLGGADCAGMVALNHRNNHYCPVDLSRFLAHLVKNEIFAQVYTEKNK